MFGRADRTSLSQSTNSDLHYLLVVLLLLRGGLATDVLYVLTNDAKSHA